ncbi:uncharacterized [Tachysurus ichikawai]
MSQFLHIHYTNHQEGQVISRESCPSYRSVSEEEEEEEEKKSHTAVLCTTKSGRMEGSPTSFSANGKAMREDRVLQSVDPPAA